MLLYKYKEMRHMKKKPTPPRNTWERKPQTQVVSSKKVYDRKRDKKKHEYKVR